MTDRHPDRQYVTTRPARVVDACALQAIIESESDGSVVTAASLAARYGLQFGAYEYPRRVPIPTAEQMARNALNQLYDRGLAAKRTPTSQVRGPGRGSTEYLHWVAAEDDIDGGWEFR